MSEDMHNAIIQRDKKTYAIVPKTTTGLVTADNLESIAKVVKKYDIPIIKITSGQRFALVGIEKENLDNVWKDLEMEMGAAKSTELCLHYVQSCPGTSVCKYGMLDSLGLGAEIEKSFTKMDLPAKMKIGVSGCPFCCGESFVRDIGVFAKKTGWTLVIGGNSARRPRIGDIIANELSDDEVTKLIEKFLSYYVENAKKKERTARFVERLGIETIKEAIL